MKIADVPGPSLGCFPGFPKVWGALSGMRQAADAQFRIERRWTLAGFR